MVTNLPKQIRQGNRRACQHAQPKVTALQKVPMRREQYANQQSEQQKRNGIFVLKPQPRRHAEPKPVARVACVDGFYHKPDASGPDEMLKDIVSQPVMSN